MNFLAKELSAIYIFIATRTGRVMTRLKKIFCGASALTAGLLIAQGGHASSHREAPGVTERPKIDSTDVYLFRSYEPGREDFVTIIANYMPLQAPYGGPNYFTFDQDALYEIHIDNDGDAIEDLTFQFVFDNELANETGIELTIGDVTQSIALRAAGPDHRARGFRFSGERVLHCVARLWRSSEWIT